MKLNASAAAKNANMCLTFVPVLNTFMVLFSAVVSGLSRPSLEMLVLLLSFWACPTSATKAWPTKSPSFPHYPGRTIAVLTGEWDFGFSAEYNISGADDVDIPLNTTAQVPGAWDAAWGTGIQYARGTGVYRTDVSIAAGHKAKLHFASCSLFCRVCTSRSFLCAMAHNATITQPPPPSRPSSPTAHLLLLPSPHLLLAAAQMSMASCCTTIHWVASPLSGLMSLPPSPPSAR